MLVATNEILLRIKNIKTFIIRVHPKTTIMTKLIRLNSYIIRLLQFANRIIFCNLYGAVCKRMNCFVLFFKHILFIVFTLCLVPTFMNVFFKPQYWQNWFTCVTTHIMKFYKNCSVIILRSKRRHGITIFCVNLPTRT